MAKNDKLRREEGRKGGEKAGMQQRESASYLVEPDRQAACPSLSDEEPRTCPRAAAWLSNPQSSVRLPTALNATTGS